MIPQRIVEAAIAASLDVIGITDHNSAENVAAVKEAARGSGLLVIGGMEVTTAEEAHVLALFDSDEELELLQQLVYANLHGSNDAEAFGRQWVVDAEGGVIDVSPRLLIGATALTIHEVVAAIHQFGGAAIAAHIGRESFSVVSQLGFVPDDLPLDAVELSPFAVEHGFDRSFVTRVVPGRSEMVTVSFSDAHFLEEVGRSRTRVVAADGSVNELLLATRRSSGRAIVEE